jgi:hypothetical protein
MALYLRGRSRCPLCDEVIDSRDGVVLFPGVALFPPESAEGRLNDAAVHLDCLLAQPYGDSAMARLREYVEAVRANRGETTT